MKNVISISVRKPSSENFNAIKRYPFFKSAVLLSFCLLFQFAIFKVQAQEETSLNTDIQIESIVSKKIETASNIADEYTVQGTVVDQDDLPLQGVNVVLKGTSEGIVTDFDGKFVFPRTLKTNEILIFSYIGYNPREYIVPESELDIIEISIAFQASDISLMGALEVEGVYSSKRNIFQKFIALFK